MARPTEDLDRAHDDLERRVRGVEAESAADRARLANVEQRHDQLVTRLWGLVAVVGIAVIGWALATSKGDGESTATLREVQRRLGILESRMRTAMTGGADGGLDPRWAVSPRADGGRATPPDAGTRPPE